jgi:hypothetical protein
MILLAFRHGPLAAKLCTTCLEPVRCHRGAQSLSRGIWKRFQMLATRADGLLASDHLMVPM